MLQPTEFKISTDGKKALKHFILMDEQGVSKKFTFTIYFKPGASPQANLELLKQYSDSKGPCCINALSGTYTK